MVLNLTMQSCIKEQIRRKRLQKYFLGFVQFLFFTNFPNSKEVQPVHRSQNASLIRGLGRYEPYDADYWPPPAQPPSGQTLLQIPLNAHFSDSKMPSVVPLPRFELGLPLQDSLAPNALPY